MKAIKTVIFTAILFFGFILASNAQGLKYVKIKTSAQTELCKANIEKSLKTEKGVESAELDLNTKIVSVKFAENKTNYDKLSDAIVKLGYDADEKKGDLNAYTKLPEECKKPLIKKSDCGTSTKSNCSSKCGSHK